MSANIVRYFVMKWTFCFEKRMKGALGIMASCRHSLTSKCLLRQDVIYLWRRYQLSRGKDNISRQDPIMCVLDAELSGLRTIKSVFTNP